VARLLRDLLARSDAEALLFCAFERAADFTAALLVVTAAVAAGGVQGLYQLGSTSCCALAARGKVIAIIPNNIATMANIRPAFKLERFIMSTLRNIAANRCHLAITHKKKP
jgi:hypothetical protein